MLETKVILESLGCKKNIILKVENFEKNTVINLNPYNNNNTNNYINKKIKQKILELPDFLKFMEHENDFYILNVSNIFECILALFDDEYFKEQDNINKKYSDFLRIKLLTDLDERFSNLKNKNQIRSILDKKSEVNDEIFYYLKEFFGVNIYLIKEKNKLIKKYSYTENNNCVFIIQIEDNYLPIIGKVDNQSVRIYNDSFTEKYEIFKNCNELLDVKSEIKLSKLSLLEIQNHAKDLKINIMKKNKKGDKDIKKTKKELITEIESYN